MNMKAEFIKNVLIEFENHANANTALEQERYMKNQFYFYGVKTEKRRQIQKPFFIHQYLPAKENLEQIVKHFWNNPHRECQYFAQELTFKYKNQIELKDIELLEFMVINKSWWDTVDFIASNLIGYYFFLYPKEKTVFVEKWLKSKNIWLQRSALLFQLKYKEKLNTEILKFTIESLLNSKEFFINKAIGWILREYGKTNPEWVITFVNKTSISNLSKREALKRIV